MEAFGPILKFAFNVLFIYIPLVILYHKPANSPYCKIINCGITKYRLMAGS